MAAHEYRYHARDLLTGTFLGRLPLNSVKYSQRLNRFGELSATCDLARRSQNGSRLGRRYLDATRPRRTVIWVERDERLIDGYIVRTRKTRNNGRDLDLRARSLWSYWHARTLKRPDAQNNYTATDQLTIARDIVNWAQTSHPNGNIGVALDSTLSGVLRDANPIAHDYERKYIGPLIEQFADNENGFDHSVEPYRVGNLPAARFTTYYPRRGRQWADGGLTFRLTATGKGNLLDYTVDEDGDSAATAVDAIGAGNGEDMLIAGTSAADMLEAGYPIEDSVVSFKDVSVFDTLARHAVEERDSRRFDLETWRLNVDGDDKKWPFGSWQVGDEAAVIVEDDDRFPAGQDASPGYSGVHRILEHAVTVDDDGGPDDINIEVGRTTYA